MDKRVIQFNERNSTKGDESMQATVKVKPIQATPELSGKDAIDFIDQVFSKPSAKAIKHNKSLLSILKKVQK